MARGTRFAIGIAVALMALMLVVSCDKVQKAGGKIKIGFILKTMQEERYQKDKAYFTAKAESLGAEVIFDSCNNDEQIQLAKFENMLSKGVDVIVLQPVNTGTAGNMVKMAKKEKVIVVGYDSLLENGPLDVHIMHNAFEVGVLEAKAFVEWMVAKGLKEASVVIIKGQAGDSYANDLTRGVKSILSTHAEVKILDEQSHEGWSTDKAMATAENVLSKYNNKIDAFLCNNSGLARGVLAALKAQNLASVDKVFVAGADADLINVRFVAQGIQGVEVYAAIKPLAEIAAEAAFMLASDKKTPAVDVLKDKFSYTMVNNGFQDVMVINANIYLVTKDTIRDTVIKLEYLTEAQVYSAD